MFYVGKKCLDLRSPECFWFPVQELGLQPELARSPGAVSSRASGWEPAACGTEHFLGWQESFPASLPCSAERCCLLGIVQSSVGHIWGSTNAICSRMTFPAVSDVPAASPIHLTYCSAGDRAAKVWPKSFQQGAWPWFSVPDPTHISQVSLMQQGATSVSGKPFLVPGNPSSGVSQQLRGIPVALGSPSSWMQLCSRQWRLSSFTAPTVS